MTTQNEYDDGQSRARKSERTFVKFVAVLLLVVVGVPVALLLVALLALAPAHRSVSIGQIAIESSYDRSLRGEISHGHSVGLDAPLPRQAPAPDPPRRYNDPETTLQAVDGIQGHDETVNLATETVVQHSELATEHSADQEPESAVEVVESPSDTTETEESDVSSEKKDVTGEVVPSDAAELSSDSDSATDAAVRVEAPETPTKPENIDLEKPLIGPPIYPEDRPKWIDPAKERGLDVFRRLGSNYRKDILREQTDGFREQVVLTETFPNVNNCLDQLEECLRTASVRYIYARLGNGRATAKVGHLMGDVRSRIVQETYSGSITTSVGEVYEAAARIRFDDAFDKDIQSRWKQVRANERIKQVGFMLGTVVVMLSTVFGYFQLDTSSKGYYTGRLRFGLVLSWLAAAALGSFISNHIWWI